MVLKTCNSLDQVTHCSEVQRSVTHTVIKIRLIVGNSFVDIPLHLFDFFMDCEAIKPPAEGCFAKLKQYRYIVYVIMLAMNFQETISRFGMPMAMVGGMTKQNCSDPLDTGTYCWSEGVKASVLGSFFYTYCLQIPVTMAARRIGFPVMLKVYLIISALMMGAVPLLVKISPYIVIISQAIRGLSAPIIMSYNYEFVRIWTVPGESMVYFATSGAMLMLGMFAGGFIAGSLTVELGWESYFYLCGVNFLVMLTLVHFFVAANPEGSSFMSKEEKSLYLNKDSEKESEAKKASYFQLMKRSYLLAFCLFIFCINMVFCTLLTNMPFYLQEVVKMRTEDISVALLVSGVGLMVGTIASARVVKRFDKVCNLSWLTRRQITAFSPPLLQVLLFLLLPNVSSTVGVVVIFVLLALCHIFMFSGSLFSLSYELDPVNSSTMCSVFNSFAQLAGFVAPKLREYITTTDQLLPHYEELYRDKWRTFFYTTAIFPMVGLWCMMLSMLLRKKEWVSAVQEKVVNPNTSEVLPGVKMVNPNTSEVLPGVKMVDEEMLKDTVIMNGAADEKSLF